MNKISNAAVAAGIRAAVPAVAARVAPTVASKVLPAAAGAAAKAAPTAAGAVAETAPGWGKWLASHVGNAGMNFGLYSGMGMLADKFTGSKAPAAPTQASSQAQGHQYYSKPFGESSYFANSVPLSGTTQVGHPAKMPS